MSATTVRGIGLVLGIWAALGLLRFKPWLQARAAPSARETLKVGYLPVT